MKTKLTHTEMLNAFRDATAGKRVDLTVSEVAALVDSIAAETHDEAVNEILIELGWKEREPQPSSIASAYELRSAKFDASTNSTRIVYAPEDGTAAEAKEDVIYHSPDATEQDRADEIDAFVSAQ